MSLRCEASEARVQLPTDTHLPSCRTWQYDPALPPPTLANFGSAASAASGFFAACASPRLPGGGAATALALARSRAHRAPAGFLATGFGGEVFTGEAFLAEGRVSLRSWPAGLFKAARSSPSPGGCSSSSLNAASASAKMAESAFTRTSPLTLRGAAGSSVASPGPFATNAASISARSLSILRWHASSNSGR